jgi:hypothetical protein
VADGFIARDCLCFVECFLAHCFLSDPASGLRFRKFAI